MMGRIIRRLLISLKGNKKYVYPEVRMTMSEGASIQHLIYQMLLDKKPCMIARFGSVEMQALVDFCTHQHIIMPFGLSKEKYLHGDLHPIPSVLCISMLVFSPLQMLRLNNLAV